MTDDRKPVYRIAVCDIEEALERAEIGQTAFTQIYSKPNRLPGWCVRLSPHEIASFAGELIIAVAQRKAIEATENVLTKAGLGVAESDDGLRTIMRHSDARDNTTGISLMLRRSEVTPDPENELLMIVFFPGYTVVDDPAAANL